MNKNNFLYFPVKHRLNSTISTLSSCIYFHLFPWTSPSSIGKHSVCFRIGVVSSYPMENGLVSIYFHLSPQFPLFPLVSIGIPKHTIGFHIFQRFHWKTYNMFPYSPKLSPSSIGKHTLCFAIFGESHANGRHSMFGHTNGISDNIGGIAPLFSLFPLENIFHGIDGMSANIAYVPLNLPESRDWGRSPRITI